MTEQQGPSPPLGALGHELVRVYSRVSWIALALGVVVGLAGPVLVLGAVQSGAANREAAITWIWFGAAVCVGSLIAAVAIAAFLPHFLLTSRDRAAAAVHSWVGAREVRRLFGSPTAAIKIPTTPEAAEQWLATQPDDPHLLPLRFEMLVLARRLDEARALIDRYPRGTPFDEYRAIEAQALVDDQQTGQPDLRDAREALARIPRGTDRAEATASLAVFEARRLIGRSDWRAPLIAARSQIPGSDLGILVRDFGWVTFQIIARLVVLPVSAFIILVAVAITVMALIPR